MVMFDPAPRTRLWGASLLLLTTTVWAQPPNSSLPPTPPGRQPLIQTPVLQDLRQSGLVMNYENIDIRVLARIMAELTGRNVVVDEGVQGRITILSSRPVTADEAWDIFKATLTKSGFGLKPVGNFLQVVNIVDRRRESPMYKGKPNSEFATAVIVMKEGDSTQLLTAIRPLLVDPNAAIAYTPSKALVVTDTAETVKKITEMVRQLDRHAPKYEVNVLFPQYLETERLAPILQGVLQRTQTTGIQESQIKVVAFPPTNSLLLQGTPQQIKEAEKVVKELDIPRAAPLTIEKPRYFIYRLQNGDATEIAKILGQMLEERKTLLAQEQQANPNRLVTHVPPPPQPATIPGLNVSQPVPSPVTGPDGEKPKTQLPFVSAKVSADKDTNAVVVYLSPTEYPQIRNLLQALDSQRRQVLVHAVVAEVSLSRLLESGSKFQTFSAPGVAATYNGGVTQEGLLSLLTGGQFVLGTAGAGSRTINVNGRDVKVPTFFSFLTGNKENRDFDLLSSPRLMTSDHKKATMKVGNVVPFATGARFSQTGQPLVTYDYKDVGIKLEFTPHLSKSDTIRLELEQEVQEVTDFLQQSLGATGYVVPLISNRRVKTDVSLKEGETLLIGGLISKRTTETIRKVPLLGDLPLISAFFSEMRKEDRKTTLFVSLTPFVIRHPDDVARIDRAFDQFVHGEPLPGDQQDEPRNTMASKHVVSDPYQEGSPTTNQVELGELDVMTPKPDDRLRQARVRLSSRGSEAQVMLRSVIRHPDGHLVRVESGPIRLQAGQSREVTLPPYDFPDVRGSYEWDVEAVVLDKVVARVPVPKKIRL